MNMALIIFLKLSLVGTRVNASELIEKIGLPKIQKGIQVEGGDTGAFVREISHRGFFKHLRMRITIPSFTPPTKTDSASQIPTPHLYLSADVPEPTGKSHRTESGFAFLPGNLGHPAQGKWKKDLKPRWIPFMSELSHQWVSDPSGPSYTLTRQHIGPGKVDSHLPKNPGHGYTHGWIETNWYFPGDEVEIEITVNPGCRKNLLSQACTEFKITRLDASGQRGSINTLISEPYKVDHVEPGLLNTKLGRVSALAVFSTLGKNQPIRPKFNGQNIAPDSHLIVQYHDAQLIGFDQSETPFLNEELVYATDNRKLSGSVIYPADHCRKATNTDPATGLMNDTIELEF